MKGSRQGLHGTIRRQDLRAKTPLPAKKLMSNAAYLATFAHNQRITPAQQATAAAITHNRALRAAET